MNYNNAVSLYELNNLVSQLIEQSLPDEVWVTGELAEGRPGSGGHFYGELVQKDARGVNIIARARITIWARNYNMIRVRFARETGAELRAGMKVQLLVRVTFHEQYGYSLNVLDVDSTYTLGDMARRRQEILRQLEEDGIIDDNRTLALPTLLQRIAVISSDKAAGYGDFCDQLLRNDYGLRFQVKLFPAIMQGSRVEESVLSALEAIANEDGCWDAVVVIRGGGAVTDLSDFDSYVLAAAIAQFPLPVFTGIGHDRDETVLDRVAHRSLKTPTAVAAFILDHQVDLLSNLQDLQQRLTQGALRRLEREKQRLDHLASTLPMSFAHVRERQEHRLQMLGNRLQTAILLKMERERHRLQLFEQRFQSLDPSLLLKRGYSMTLSNGRIVTDASQVSRGDALTTCFANGRLTSVVSEVQLDDEINK